MMRKLVWTEGLFITQHHFQQLDRYHEELLAERMRAGLHLMPVTFRPEAVTASFGVAQGGPDDNVARLVDRADEALYDAKHGGRDRVVARHESSKETSDG